MTQTLYSQVFSQCDKALSIRKALSFVFLTFAYIVVTFS